MDAFPDDDEARARREAAARAVVAGLVNHSIFHRDGPVVAVKRCRRDVIVKKAPLDNVDPLSIPLRGDIREFSFKSRLRLLHWAKNCDVDFWSMLTVTYPSEFPRDGRQVKRDLDCLKKWLVRESEDIRGLWFLEFQKRGAPHFHFLLSLVLEHQGPMVIKRRTRKFNHRTDTYSTCQRVEDRASAAWFRIVGSGDEKHLRAGVCWEAVDEPDACLRYAAAHAAKPHQKTVPKEFQNVGRFWGKLGKVEVIEGDWEAMTVEQLFAEFGPDAMSSKGRVKKFLWDRA